MSFLNVIPYVFQKVAQFTNIQLVKTSTLEAMLLLPAKLESHETRAGTFRARFEARLVMFGAARKDSLREVFPH